MDRSGAYHASLLEALRQDCSKWSCHNEGAKSAARPYILAMLSKPVQNVPHLLGGKCDGVDKESSRQQSQWALMRIKRFRLSLF